jgi:hypothetical protein
MYTINYPHHLWAVEDCFSLQNIEKNFNVVIEMLYQKIPKLMPFSVQNVKKDYCVYVAGSAEIKYYGVTWVKEEVVYSAKGNAYGLKDLYIIHPEGPIASKEIDWDTLQPVAIYDNDGFTKKSLDGQTLLVSYEINSVKDLPSEFVDECKAQKFPWYVFAYGFSVKPYGATIEFSLPEWANLFYN